MPATASVAFVETSDVSRGRAVVYDRTVEVLDLRAVLERDAERSGRVGRVTVPEVGGVRTNLRRRSRGLRTEFTAEIRAADRSAAGVVAASLLRDISCVSAMAQTTLEACVNRRPAAAYPDPSLVRRVCEGLRRAGYETLIETLWEDAGTADLYLALDADGRELIQDLPWISVTETEVRDPA